MATANTDHTVDIYSRERMYSYIIPTTCMPRPRSVFEQFVKQSPSKFNRFKLITFVRSIDGATVVRFTIPRRAPSNQIDAINNLIRLCISSQCPVHAPSFKVVTD